MDEDAVDENMVKLNEEIKSIDTKMVTEDENNFVQIDKDIQVNVAKIHVIFNESGIGTPVTNIVETLNAEGIIIDQNDPMFEEGNHDLSKILETYSRLVEDNPNEETKKKHMEVIDYETYERVKCEKITIEILLKETVENLNAMKREIASKDRKISSMVEDNGYLRTENQKLKNKLKVINVIGCNVEEGHADTNETSSDTIQESEFCIKTYRELNDLRQEFSDFRKYMGELISVVKNGHDESTSSSSTGFDVSVNAVNAASTPIQNSGKTTDVGTNGNNENGHTSKSSKKTHLVPGPRPYSRADVPDTIILSDSTVGRLTSKQLKEYLDTRKENVILKKYPGHTADEINYYCDKPLDDIQARQVIIIAGTNDISRGNYKKNIDEAKIVADILSIAEKARMYGAENVFIGSILERKGQLYKSVITRINDELFLACVRYGYVYMDNNDITVDYHIGGDGIHPNEQGHTILKMNILKCMYSFNPYLCDFYDYYENCLL